MLEQEESWNDVDFWVKELHYYLPTELDDGMPVLFVGNKKDLVDKRDDEQKIVNFKQVDCHITGIIPYSPSTSQVREVANAYGFLPPMEVSAKTGHGVDKAFMAVARQLAKNVGDDDRPGQPKIPKPSPSCCSIS